MGNEGTDRTAVESVSFGPLKEALREHQYPVTRAELIEVYGGFEFDLPDGAERLEDVLGRVDDGAFRDPREVRDAILTGLDAGDAFEAPIGDGVELADDGDWSRKSL